MPRTAITLTETIEHLSVLNEHGEVDTDLEPEISQDTLLELYRAMLLGRRFDERMLDLQRQGRIGTFPPIKGQEAAQMGSIIHLKESDWLVPAFRETAAEIWRGRSLESVLLYYNGFNEGTIIPEQQKDMPMSVPVGSQILHATGIGYGAKYRKNGEIVMTYFGDGATSEGDFHEGLNCAAVYQVPVVFICQNNQWAISIPLKQQTRSETIAQKALAYGMPGIQVDGNDILAVYVATQEAVQRARNGGGPTLIECVTYRVMMHTTADDPSRYRSDEEVEKWKLKCPLSRFEKYLQQKNILNDTNCEEIESLVLDRIQTAIHKAEQQMAAPPDPLDMFDHLFEKLPPHITRQKEEVLRYLNSLKTGNRREGEHNG
ncbi:pyruvate dehydrogenase (acetyl-transferring) E1 component subunit alpha [Desulfosediminicola ganghwensis]|uniref:pyruvate dehydrogenase (acetyl-transferring) E1 component subunit alpha n=1 Tax=Desulfosediminicola ganghwensis TaxID=2569540 RepID=UPI0010AC6B5C|nr:pyruvate dehydrogenase (acetyl-transferring) E1 component subunit alpha [Desulfosediminicola ganghwensis]